jgi:hypothetical protein
MAVGRCFPHGSVFERHPGKRQNRHRLMPSQQTIRIRSAAVLRCVWRVGRRMGIACAGILGGKYKWRKRIGGKWFLHNGGQKCHNG